MLKCIDYEKMISPYIDNELEKTECDSLIAHLSTCQACKAQEVLYRTIKDTLSNEIEIELPEDFNIKLHNKLQVESEKIKKENIKINKFKNIKVFSTLAAGFLILILGASLISSGYFNISLSKRATETKDSKNISMQESAVSDNLNDNFKYGGMPNDKLDGNLNSSANDIIKGETKVDSQATKSGTTKEITNDITPSVTTTTSKEIKDTNLGATSENTTDIVNKKEPEISPKVPQLMGSTVMADVAIPNVISVKSKNKDDDSKKLTSLTEKYSSDKAKITIAADQAISPTSASSFTLKSKSVEESKKSFSLSIKSGKFDAFKAELEDYFSKTNIIINGDISKINNAYETDLDINIEINLVD